MGQEDEIFVWRSLPDPLDPGQSIDVAWMWSGWDHAARERDHVLEAATLWRLAFDSQVVEPFLAALSANSLESCRGAFQAIAQVWKDAFEEAFHTPRVLHTIATKQGANYRRSVFQFVSSQGVIFINRHRRESSYELTTFYFPESLVNGLAVFPQVYARNARNQLIDLYTRESRGLLPDPAKRRHFAQRRHEVDREIRFVKATAWGFESEEPGARWLKHPEDDDLGGDQLSGDVPIEPPPSAPRPSG